MEKRNFTRKIVNFKVKLLFDGLTYVGSVENITEEGLYVIANLSRTLIDITSGAKLELKFKLPSGESFNLPCQVKWSYKTPPHGLTFSMGMKILKQSPEYMKFISAFN